MEFGKLPWLDYGYVVVSLPKRLLQLGFGDPDNFHHSRTATGSADEPSTRIRHD